MKQPSRMWRRSTASLAVLGAILVLQLASSSQRLGAQAGAVTITTLGSPVSQNFDGLPASGSATWVNNTTIPGWYHARTGTGSTIVANNGGSTAGNLYSYGTGTATDRALGSLGSGNAAVGHLYWGVRLANGTASTITSLTIAYTGEQWRNSAAVAQTVEFSYLTGANLGSLADFEAAGVAVDPLDFTSPITGGTAGALDGNLAPNRTALSFTIDGLSLPPGAEILLRWSDVDHGGSDHGLAVDDLTITANGTDVPAVSIDNVSVPEGNTGTSLATFTVSVSSGSHPGITFDIATADGTGPAAATAADGDYVPRAESGQVIPPGVTTFSFAVSVNGDPTVEPDETFVVNLANVTGATVIDGQGEGVIATDDAPPPVSADVKISQIYGGGGNAGATLTHDFVELFNSGTTTVNLSGWSVQYTGATSSATWSTTALSGSIPPGGYYLVQQAQGTGGTTPLPSPDAVGTTPMAAGAGKVALRSTTTPLAGSCSLDNTVIDLVGYGGTANCFEGTGPVAAPSNTTGALRKRSGCFDSDNNNIDLAVAAPSPRNSASPTQSCTPVAAAIHDIQGPGLVTPYAGRYVTTTGIVTGLKTNGFFIQTPESSVDSDPLTSEALFVFTSTAPVVAVGNEVTVGGTATEFFNLTQLEATLPGDVQTTSTGQAIPGPVTLTTAILDPAGTPQQLEPYEGMRMFAASLTSVAPSNEFGEVMTVLTGVARPMREPGIPILDPVPPDPSTGVTDCCIPRFDENPERIVIDSDGLAGALPVSVTSHVVLTDVTGPLDFTFGQYKLLPETVPSTTANISGIPVSVPAADEFTIAGFNIENFSGETQRRKAALAIRQLMRSPDVIGHIEIPDLASLQALAAQVNADAVAAGDADPGYEAVLIPAPIGGTQHVGFLVKTSRVRIDGVSQERAAETFTNPINGQQETLHDRPPLVLRATVDPSGTPQAIIVIVNHLRSFIDVELVSGEGVRVRAKRTAQAESLAGLLQELQVGNPGTPIISIGDYNAYQFSDGYTDPIAVITGTPTPDDQIVVDQSPDLVEPNFVNLTGMLPTAEQYSFIFEGTPQALDHVLVNQVANALVRRYAIVRGNSDFPEVPAALFAADPTRPERSSDHDMPVAYFRLPTPDADLAIAMTAAPETTPAGQNVTFTITATNNGPSPAQSVLVTNHASPMASIVSCQATGGGVCNTVSGATTVAFSSLAPGATEVITLVAALSCAVPNNAVVVDMATIGSSTADTNSGNNAASASTIASNAAPSITGALASPSRLLLPLHQMVPVNVSYSASDTCGPVTTTLAVTSDEPVTGPILVQGLAGLTSPDWQVVNDHQVRLRAERSLRGDGRVYTLTITAADTAGGTSTRQVTVTVPR
jgi:uncharacterized repeat protein (TIGR01451 family)